MIEQLKFSISLSIQYWVYIPKNTSIWSSLLFCPPNSLLKLSSHNSCPCLVEFLRVFVFENQLIYNVVLISPAWQGDSVIHMQFLINTLKKKISFPLGLIKGYGIKFPVLHSRTFFTILYIIVCICVFYCYITNYHTQELLK